MFQEIPAAAEVRLVRCPKCGRVLPEIANIPVYQCGGCQTTLQAKNRGGARSASQVSETQAEAAHLPSGKREEKCAEGRVEESSCVEGQRQRQRVEESSHELQSRQDKKQNWASESSCSDDNGNGCGFLERASDVCFSGEEEVIDLAQSHNSSKLPLNHKYEQTQSMSNTQNPLYHPQASQEIVRENTVERSDGSSGRLYHSRINRLGNSASSSSSGELLHRSPRPCQGTRSSTHSKTLTNTVSNLMPPTSLSNDLDSLKDGDKGFVKPSWNSRHQPAVVFHEEATRAKTRSNGAVFREGLLGPATSNGRVLCRPVDDSSTEWDYSIQIDSEIDHPMDAMDPNPFDLQSVTKNKNFGSLTNQSKLTQLEMEFQRRERNMDWQNRSHHKLQSQLREQNQESNPGTDKMHYFQISDSLQPSQHGQLKQGVKERRPHFSGNKPLESDRSDFYMNSKGPLQFNENYDNGEFDYNGNLPQMHETEIQILEKRLELLKKLDELRDELSRSCQVAYSSTVQAQHNIGTTVVTPETRPVVVERELFRKGHGVFMPTANEVESLTCGDYSDGSQRNSGQLAYGPRKQSVPWEAQHRMHLEHEPWLGMMDEEDISNGFTSKHINPQDFGHRMSHGLYVDKRNVTAHKIPQMSYSGEQGLKPQRRTYHVSHRSVDEEQNSYTCSCCSRHSLQHPRSCYSCPYQDGHPLHMPLHVPPTAFYHQMQVHTATNHMHFSNSYPTHSRAQVTPSHHHPRPYREGSDIQRYKSKESELILYQEKKYAQEAAARKRRTLPCLPFAGGAPFVLCDNCLQLLLIPGDLSPSTQKKHKLQCGTCFSIFVLTIQSKRHVITVAKHTDYPSRYMQKSRSKAEDPGISAASHATSSSGNIQNMLTNERDDVSHGDDYDISISKPHSANGKHDFLQLAPAVQHNLLKSQSLSSEPHLSMARIDEGLQDCDSSPKYLHDMRSYEARDSTAKAEGSSVPDLASPMAGSPLHEHFGYSSPLAMINKVHQEKTTVISHRKSGDLGKSKSNHSDNTFGGDHTKMAGKRDVSVSLPRVNAGLDTSKDVAEMENQEDLSKESGKSWNTSIKGFLKKSLKDLKKGNQGLEVVRSNVFVNGRPIPDNLVKKAEEHAGSVQPGHYWYDYQAGFWGVMGEPCRGIIPPFIEEFNHPMPRDCAGGKTRILVNGRELHQKDLDLLAGRGLPTTKDKSYRVEISGRVVDKATNTELKSLGKLAPTLERKGRGVGMRTPRKRS